MASVYHQAFGASSTAGPSLAPSSRVAHFSLKRVIDIGGSLVALILLAPLLACVAMVIFATDRGSIFFGHARVGKGGADFRCWKFRTMRRNSDQLLSDLLASDPSARMEWLSTFKLQRDPRVTPLGRFLRRTSIDELPQLFNVLMGDMSLVGPRPIVYSETSKYGRYLDHYLRVRPGLTGLWQVNGRNRTTYRRRVALDVMYSRKMSLTQDISILLATVPVILRADGY